MKDRLTLLLDKYYTGETTLAEEKELKSLLSKSDAREIEKSFFSGIQVLGKAEPMKIKLPSSPAKSISWWQYAAVIVFFLVGGYWIYTTEQRHAEQEAYQKVMQAFQLIQSNMEKGTNQMHIMEDLRHLNTTDELFNISDKFE